MSILVSVVKVFVDAHGEHGNPLGILWASRSTKGAEQQIAADLGFSETVFVESIEGHEARARIFTPSRELAFAGHPTVGLASWLHDAGDDITSIAVPAGVAQVRAEGDLTFISARADWAPRFDLQQLAGPEDVLAVDPDAYGTGAHYVWAWAGDDHRRVRARMFAPELGIREDQATGAAAIRLTAAVDRDLEIIQGGGSQIFTRRRQPGPEIEVGGRTTSERIVELP